MTNSAIPYAFTTLLIVGCILLVLGYILDSIVETDVELYEDTNLPYSQQRSDTWTFMFAVWSAYAFVCVVTVAAFLIQNGIQQETGGV